MITTPKQLAQKIYEVFSLRINKLFVDSVASDQTKVKLKQAVESILVDMVPQERQAEYFMEISVRIVEPSPGKYAYIPDNMLTGLLLSFVPFYRALPFMLSDFCIIDGIKYELKENGMLITFPDSTKKED